MSNTSELRLPPQNMIAEKALLGSQMLDVRTVDEIRDIVSPRDFYADVNATIQKAILKLRDAGSNLDALILADQLQSTGDFEDIGGTHYLMDLMDSVPHSGHAQHYARIVLDCSKRRQVISMAQKLIEKSHDMAVDDESTVDAAVSAVEKISNNSAVSVTFKPLVEAVSDVISNLEKGIVPAANVMIPAIDGMTDGTAAGEMIVMGARPSHGKTLVAMQSLDCCASHGMVGMIISEEMTAELLAMRSLSALSAIPSEIWLQQTHRLRFDAREHYQNRSQILIAEKCGTAASAERAIALGVRKFGVQVVAVDYAQLLRGEGSIEQERIADVSQRMKAAAVKYGVRMILLSQMNRGIEIRPDPEPTNADLRGSGSLEQDADIILFPFHPWQLNQKYEHAREYRIYQTKNRNRGIKKPVMLMTINKERQRIELDNPDSEIDEYSRDWQ